MNRALFSNYIATFTICVLSLNVWAEEDSIEKKYEFTPYIGYTFSNDIEDAQGEDLDMSDDPNIGFSISWYDSKSGKGQVIVNYVGHDFHNEIAGTKEDLSLLYTHFSGIALLEQSHYTTTFELGFGATYMDSDFESGIYPSATVAIGARYDMSPTMAILTDIRSYATLTEDDGEFFCQQGTCVADFGTAIYFDTSISVGISFSF